MAFKILQCSASLMIARYFGVIIAECQSSCWLPADATISETPTFAQFCWTGGSQCEQRAGYTRDERWSRKSDTESGRSRNSASDRAHTTFMCSSRNHRPAFPHAHSATAASIRCQPGCHHASEQQSSSSSKWRNTGTDREPRADGRTTASRWATAATESGIHGSRRIEYQRCSGTVSRSHAKPCTGGSYCRRRRRW